MHHSSAPNARAWFSGRRVPKSALALELRKQGLDAEVEKRILVYYDGQVVGRHYLDVLVQGEVILELKTVDAFSKASDGHGAELR
ncbi:MAG: GxxExxY protein [Longimicrobiales bacterium]